MTAISLLEKHRRAYTPKLPASLAKGVSNVSAKKGQATESMSDAKEIKALFPHTYGLPIINLESAAGGMGGQAINIGVVLSGGQAPGGHNVICGIYDALQNANTNSKLIGFLGGPSGLEDGKYIVLDKAIIDNHRNTGGFDIIGSGRTKLETVEQFEKCRKVIADLKIDAIAIIGGDDSNTNAAVLAEYIKSKGDATCVIGVPKTIDGDLKNEYIPTSFGFDTASKTYAEMVGNIERDARSAKKYWHFVKLMGRSASHIALEVGLQTRANVTLISEEVEQKQMSLDQVVEVIVQSVVDRAKAGKNYGVALVPEGLIEFIPNLKQLVSTLNNMLAAKEAEFNKIEEMPAKIAWVGNTLPSAEGFSFKSLPEKIQAQLLFDRDPHGNVQVSKIETEVLLIEMVAKKLKALKAAGTYTGKFSAQNHFFGYEGRCAPPSNFDADYCYALGQTAVILALAKATGYMASLRGVTKPASEWQAGGIPITMMFNLEQRHGKMKPVIKKALVELDGKPFQQLAQNRASWAVEDAFLYPGPIQYFGPSEVCDTPTMTLRLEHGVQC